MSNEVNAVAARVPGQRPKGVIPGWYIVAMGVLLMAVIFGTIVNIFSVFAAPVAKEIGATRMATLRMCLQVTGEHNLIFSVLSPTVAAMGGVQSVLGKHLPWMRANESRVLLRSPKRMGWLFDTQGRPTGRLVLPALWEPGVW